MVTSTHTRVKTQGCFSDTSVDPTEARNTIRQAESPLQRVGLRLRATEQKFSVKDSARGAYHRVDS
jgi:hypothetical protein